MQLYQIVGPWFGWHLGTPETGIEPTDNDLYLFILILSFLSFLDLSVSSLNYCTQSLFASRVQTPCASEDASYLRSLSIHLSLSKLTVFFCSDCVMRVNRRALVESWASFSPLFFSLLNLFTRGVFRFALSAVGVTSKSILGSFSMYYWTG